MNKTKRLVVLSLLLAISVVISYVESFIPIPIPGVKLGLANMVVLLLLYEDSIKSALIILILRILIVGLIRGTIFMPTWFMSVGGGISSFIVMLIFKHIRVLATITVSVLGSLAHCIGQILVAMLLLSSSAIIYYLPIIMLLSIFTGILSGVITMLMRKRYKEIALN